MAAQDRRERQRAERHQLIIDTARGIAESEGWDAVTTRRLADRIEYSQPVLYSHFAGKDAIVGAVALQGFVEFADTLRADVSAAPDSASALGALARGYLRFAELRPAVYAAMFSMDTDLTFARADTPPALRTAFEVMRDTLGAATGTAHLETRTELAWATLHGLATLTAGNRLRPEQAHERLTLLVEHWRAAAPHS
ncbi:TetR/AcrR family transcriptional regulator [Pseudonocardia spinosispora]|uniref:TetR/AcrR family transcriptional regulator n=1 Tax=Pseudonocardia spinosispora TaxID=103441 RepID=UPI0003F6CF1B|nr:TetR/AcrR family transcriptional regulator [Pseudonocardia spinosispora]